MTRRDGVPLLSPDGDLAAVLWGDARATPDLIDAMDAVVSASADSTAGAAHAVAYESALHIDGVSDRPRH